MQHSTSHRSIGRNPNRRHALGQHLLVSDQIAERMIGYAGIRERDLVFEIGTGTGVLTEKIARIARSVVSFEIDSLILETAKSRLSGFNNIKLEAGDALSHSNRDEFDLCISSLPYSRSLDFVEWIANRATSFRCAVVIVQKEFAEKLLASRGSNNYRAVSVICQSCFSVEKLEAVNRTAFDPPPNVLSYIIRMTPRKDSTMPGLQSSQITLIKNIFSFRGRVVRAALKKMGLLELHPKAFTENFLMTRVEKLRPADFLLIANVAGE